MSEITITTRTLRQLVEPIIPLAGKDDMLPVLTAVQVRSKGKWLIASATDRYRLGMKRVAAAEGQEWPAFEALIPTRALKTILTTFKPVRGLDPELTLTVENDKLIVTAAGGLMSDMLDARAAFYLMQGEYPKLDSVVTQTIKAEQASTPQGFNANFLADFRHAQVDRGTAIQIKQTEKPKGSKEKDGPLLILGEDFIGVLMPRRLFGDPTGAIDDGSDWLDLLEPAQAAAVTA